MALQDKRVSARAKIAALWATFVLLFLYGDLIGIFRPGTIEDITNRKLYVFDINQLFLLAISVYVMIPTAMIFLSLVLKANLVRWLSIIIAIIYTLTALGSAIGDDYAYYISS